MKTYVMMFNNEISSIINMLDPKSRDIRGFISEAIVAWILWKRYRYSASIYRVGANFYTLSGVGLPEIQDLYFGDLQLVDREKAHLITDVARGCYNPKPDFLIMRKGYHHNMSSLKAEVKEVCFIEVKSKTGRKSIKYNKELAQSCKEVGVKFMLAIFKFQDNWKLNIEFKEC